MVASHQRVYERNQRQVIPAHFEAAFEHKPRARIMVYRDWLVKLSPSCATYISEICRTQRQRMNEQIVAMYDLAQQLGVDDFLSALSLAAEQHLLGAEYLSAIAQTTTAKSRDSASSPLNVIIPPQDSLPIPHQLEFLTALGVLPDQREIERDLSQYEAYVSNRPQLELNVKTEVKGVITEVFPTSFSPTLPLNSPTRQTTVVSLVAGEERKGKEGGRQ